MARSHAAGEPRDRRVQARIRKHGFQFLPDRESFCKKSPRASRVREDSWYRCANILASTTKPDRNTSANDLRARETKPVPRLAPPLFCQENLWPKPDATYSTEQQRMSATSVAL